MSSLAKGNCVICKKGSPVADEQQSKKWLQELPDWKIIDCEGMLHLFKSYQFKNFVTAQAFSNKIGEIAEEENHHPKLTLEWGNVKVEWWTHSIGGLHKNDFIMAAKTDLYL